MATDTQQTGTTDILPDVLKTALAPMAGFQRDFQTLTQGLNEFRNDLRLATAETTRTWREGLDRLSDVLIKTRDYGCSTTRYCLKSSTHSA